MNDKFSRLKAIQQNQDVQSIAGQNLIFWDYDRDGDIIGTIVEFNSFPHPKYGMQHTVVVRLADSNELISAFLSGWLQEGMRRQQASVGDLVLIKYLGKQPGETFKRFHLVIEKPFHDSF